MVDIAPITDMIVQFIPVLFLLVIVKVFVQVFQDMFEDGL